MYCECGEIIEKYVRPATYPFVVKMLKREDDIPKGAKQPKRDFGTLIDVCQAFALARRDKMEIALLKEDIWCPEPVIGYGFAEPPKYFLEGHMWYPWGNRSLEHGVNQANSFPRFEVGKYVGIVVAPYMNADFEPDLLITYGNASQMKRLIDGIRDKDGTGVGTCHNGRCVGFGNGACIRAVVPAIQTSLSQITIPCGGDHKYAMAQDDELIFTIPKEEFKYMIRGLKRTEEIGVSSYPYKFNVTPEHEFHKSYMKLRELMKMTEAQRGDCGKMPWYGGIDREEKNKK